MWGGGVQVGVLKGCSDGGAQVLLRGGCSGGFRGFHGGVHGGVQIEERGGLLEGCSVSWGDVQLWGGFVQVGGGVSGAVSVGGKGSRGKNIRGIEGEQRSER